MAKELQRKFEKSRVDAEAAYRKKLNSLLDIDSDPLTDPEVMRSAQASADNEREQGLLQMQRNIDAQRMAEERQAARQKKMEGTMDAAETRRRDQEAASMFKRQPLSEGGKFPDLTGDGKVTQADVLKGRKVFQEGGLSAKDMKSTFSSRASEIFKASGKELNFPNANPTVRSYSKGVDEGRYDTPERFNKGLKAFEEDLLAENFPEKFDKMEQAEIKAAAKRFPTKKGDDRKNKAEGSKAKDDSKLVTDSN